MSFTPSTNPIALGVIKFVTPVATAVVHAASGGTLYVIGDHLIPPSPSDAVITVLTVDGVTGAVLTLSVTTPGTLTAAGTNLTTTTNSVAGTGATLDITVSTAPVPLSVNLAAGVDDSCFEVYLQAYKTIVLGANTGLVRVTDATGAQIIKTMAKSEAWAFSEVGDVGNPIRLSNLFLSADTAGDALIGYAIRR